MILDTSFLVDFIRGRDIKTKEKSEELDKKFVIKAISTITLMELWKGAMQSINSDNEKIKISELLDSLFVYPFNEDDAKKAGEIEAMLRRNGDIIDIEDVMIAATAIVRNEPLITRNVKHFSKIKGLEVISY